MSRRQWFAVSVDVFDSDLGVDLRDEFGPVGLCMWIGFLAACKRNAVPGKIRYSNDSECLSLMGLPGVELVDEDGEPFKLDDFWSFLGRMKQTKVTRSKRLVDVSATRWEQWQDDARLARERERKRRSRAKTGRTEDGQDADEKRSDNDHDNDTTTTTTQPADEPPDLVEAFERFWDVYPRHEKKALAKKAFPKAVDAAGSVDVVINGAQRYADNVVARNVGKEFIAHPTSWLNAERWDDELPNPEEDNQKGFM